MGRHLLVHNLCNVDVATLAVLEALRKQSPAAAKKAPTVVAPSIIQEVMRHEKFTTTQKYIHVDAARMLDAVNTLQADGDPCIEGSGGNGGGNGI